MPRLHKAFVFSSLVCVFAAFGTPPVEAQVTIARKHVQGSKSSFQIENTVAQTLTLNGRDIVTKSNVFSIVDSTTDQTEIDGTLKVVDKIQSLQLELDINGTKIQFDSANPEKKADLPQLEPILELYRSTFSLPIIATVDVKTQKIKSVAVPDGEFEKLSGEAKSRFDPEKLKKAFEQNQGYLPDDDVKRGDKWERSSELNLGQGQVMSFRTTYEYIGTVDQDGVELDKIEGKPFEVAFSIVGNPVLQVTKSELKIKEGSSTHLFDRKKGQLVSSVAKTRIEGPLTIVIGGMELGGKVDLTIDNKSTRQK